MTVELLPGERLDENGRFIHATSDRGEATFSLDRRFRYKLYRWLTPRAEVEARGEDRMVTFVMLNPSTADAFIDDPTVAKCIKFARRLNADTLCVVNLFALRATDPSELRKAGTAVAAGADEANHYAILVAAGCSTHVIAAWGTHAKNYDRHALVCSATGPLDGIPLHHLGLTKDFGPSKPRYPMHPLYRPDAQEFIPWE